MVFKDGLFLIVTYALSASIFIGAIRRLIGAKRKSVMYVEWVLYGVSIIAFIFKLAGFYLPINFRPSALVAHLIPMAILLSAFVIETIVRIRGGSNAHTM